MSETTTQDNPMRRLVAGMDDAELRSALRRASAKTLDAAVSGLNDAAKKVASVGGWIRVFEKACGKTVAQLSPRGAES